MLVWQLRVEGGEMGRSKLSETRGGSGGKEKPFANFFTTSISILSNQRLRKALYYPTHENSQVPRQFKNLFSLFLLESINLDPISHFRQFDIVSSTRRPEEDRHWCR